MRKLIGRRLFVGGTLAGSAIAAPFAIVRGAPATFASYPFTLGVASGAPREDGVVLWTRLAPQPLEGGGMPNDTVEVEWQGSWWPAMLLERRGARWLVHYDHFGDEWDEVVGDDRIRPRRREEVDLGDGEPDDEPDP